MDQRSDDTVECPADGSGRDPRSPFAARGPQDVRRLIEAYPLAWVCAASGDTASLLPLVGVFDAHDELVEIIGHFARSNPLGDAFAQNSRASILFTGPQGYISPRQVGRPDWAPTWNYAQLRFKVEIAVEPELTASAVDLLVNHMEKDRAEPWSAAELGERYDLLLPHIVGFRARVVEKKVKFKLGQDETLETLSGFLSNSPDDDLARWMRLFNVDRLGSARRGRGE